MNKPKHQKWPDGTRVRFTEEARKAMQNSPHRPRGCDGKVRQAAQGVGAETGQSPEARIFEPRLKTPADEEPLLFVVVEIRPESRLPWAAERHQRGAVQPEAQGRRYCKEIRDDAHGVSMGCFLSDGHNSAHAWTRNAALPFGHPRREPGPAAQPDGKPRPSEMSQHELDDYLDRLVKAGNDDTPEFHRAYRIWEQSQ